MNDICRWLSAEHWRLEALFAGALALPDAIAPLPSPTCTPVARCR